jgi:drug/metabolite transporter (DMT)-like permease
MFFLIASILTSASLVVILKLFKRFEIDTLQAVVANYWVCTITGCLVEKYNLITAVSTIADFKWFYFACILGCSFIILINLMGWTAQQIGLTTVSVANKLSLIIPVAIAFIFFHEKFSWMKVLAILMALVAVLLVTYQKSDKEKKVNWLFFVLPLILFVGSGMNDTVVNYVQKNFLPEAEKAPFVIWIFQIAALIGTSILIILFILKKKKFAFKNMIAGFCLGIPNYFSMYYLVKALADSGFPSSELFPINNVSIVICSSLSGIIFFKEHLKWLQTIGIILAAVSIFMLM